MEEFGIGQPVLRKEDARPLTGRAAHTDDMDRPGQARASVVSAGCDGLGVPRIDTRPAPERVRRAVAA